MGHQVFSNNMKKIDVYSTENCHFCHMEKEFLIGHNIPFNDHDVTNDMEKRVYIRDLTGQMGVPVTVITDTDHPDADPLVFVGFAQGLFEEKLGISHDDNMTKIAA